MKLQFPNLAKQEAPSSTPGFYFSCCSAAARHLSGHSHRSQEGSYVLPCRGHDGLLPQHLKDLVSPTLGEVGASFVEALASLVSQLISGNVPHPSLHFSLGPDFLASTNRIGVLDPLQWDVLSACWQQSAWGTLFLRKWAPCSSPFKWATAPG